LAVALLLCFAKPLLAWVSFAWQSDLYSYVLLVPIISAFLGRSCFRTSDPVRRFIRAGAIPPLSVGLLALGGYWVARLQGWNPALQDYLALMIFSLVCLFLAGSFFFLDISTLSRLAFPLGFLFFAVPFPHWIEAGLAAFLQEGSTYVTHGMLSLSGIRFVRHGFSFELPGLTLIVAPECSGIHSTVVLFVTSVLAGYLFLKSPARRAILALAVLPLALLRNGFRIFTIAQLCYQLGLHWLNSWVHHQGGPLFFTLSLIPLAALLFWLRHSETKAGGPKTPPDQGRELKPI
jgi:exosortase C (VPDSG-CTERM-specific)